MVAVVAVVVGLLGGACLLARLRGLPPAPAQRDDCVADPRDVTIVVPARNECRSLPALLQSIAQLDPAPLEVIVVDDASTDETAEIASASGATVLRAPPRPGGWLGKPWACWTGARHARGTWLLFLDADIRLAPDALARICALGTTGLLSVQPFHDTRFAYESLSGVFNLVTIMGSGAFAPRARASRIAFGPCIFTSRTDYSAVGGHESVRGAIVEDAALAARFDSCSLPVRHRAGNNAVAYRMYPDGVRALVDGWTRTLAAGATTAGVFPVAVAAGWVAACATSTVLAVEWLVAGGGGVRSPLLYAATALVTAVLLRRVGRFRWWTWTAFPVPLACFVLVFARSIWCTHVKREVVWRDRRINLVDSTTTTDRGQ